MTIELLVRQDKRGTWIPSILTPITGIPEIGPELGEEVR